MGWMRIRPTAARARRITLTAAIAIGLFASVAAGGCVGKLGRNDDYVRPDSDHPSAGN